MTQRPAQPELGSSQSFFPPLPPRTYLPLSTSTGSSGWSTQQPFGTEEAGPPQKKTMVRVTLTDDYHSPLPSPSPRCLCGAPLTVAKTTLPLGETPSEASWGGLLFGYLPLTCPCAEGFVGRPLFGNTFRDSQGWPSIKTSSSALVVWGGGGGGRGTGRIQSVPATILRSDATHSQRRTEARANRRVVRGRWGERRADWGHGGMGGRRYKRRKRTGTGARGWRQARKEVGTAGPFFIPAIQIVLWARPPKIGSACGKERRRERGGGAGSAQAAVLSGRGSAIGPRVHSETSGKQAGAWDARGSYADDHT